MKRTNFFFWTAVFLALAVGASADTVPVEISVPLLFYNATDGVALNGTHNVLAHLYAEASDGSSDANQSQDVSFFNGVGHFVFDNLSTITDWSVRYRITIEAGGSSETSPRVNLTPIPQSLYAENATFSVNASNATFAVQAHNITGKIIESQIDDLQAYVINGTNVVFEVINASGWDNVSIDQLQIEDFSILGSVGSQNQTANFTASHFVSGVNYTSLNITGDSDSILTKIVENVLTIYATVTDKITEAFTRMVHFEAGLNATGSVNVTGTLSLETYPAECSPGSYVTEWNGSASVCVSAARIDGDNLTGSYNVSNLLIVDSGNSLINATAPVSTTDNFTVFGQSGGITLYNESVVAYCVQVLGLANVTATEGAWV